MKRKTFIKNVIIAGAGMQVLPLRSFAFGVRKDFPMFEIPCCTEMVRHGNLFRNTDQHCSSNFRWLKDIRKHVFSKNGINTGKDDLLHVTIKLDSLSFPDALTLGIFEREVIYSLHGGMLRKRLVKNAVSQLYEDSNYTIGLCFTSSPMTFKPTDKAEVFVANLKGDLSVNQRILKENQGVEIRQVKSLALHPHNEALVLVLKKRDDLIFYLPNSLNPFQTIFTSVRTV